MSILLLGFRKLPCSEKLLSSVFDFRYFAFIIAVIDVVVLINIIIIVIVIFIIIVAISHRATECFGSIARNEFLTWDNNNKSTNNSNNDTCIRQRIKVI